MHAYATRQLKTSITAGRAVVASVYRTETEVPCPTGTSAYPTSAPELSRARSRHRAGRLSRLRTVSVTVAEDPVTCSVPATLAWYGGSPPPPAPGTAPAAGPRADNAHTPPRAPPPPPRAGARRA